VADWNGAIESWTRALEARRKIAGRAAYNIAVGWEVLGEIEKAKEWASRAYTEYNDKMAKDYYDQLVYRQREEEIIRRQIPQE
jgi:tetratricopeptide (TPR) repeat protein